MTLKHCDDGGGYKEIGDQISEKWRTIMQKQTENLRKSFKNMKVSYIKNT